MNTLTTIILMFVFLAYTIYRTLRQLPVTRRSVLLPLIIGLYVGYSTFQHANSSSVAFVLAGAGIGLLLGFLISLQVRVWRDAKSGVVYQKGDRLIVYISIGIIVLRLTGMFLLQQVNVPGMEEALNGAMLTMSLGTFLGRSLMIGLRALALNK